MVRQNRRSALLRQEILFLQKETKAREGERCAAAPALRPRCARAPRLAPLPPRVEVEVHSRSPQDVVPPDNMLHLILLSFHQISDFSLRVPKLICLKKYTTDRK